MISPGDLLTEADLRALDAGINTAFGDSLGLRLIDKRRIAVTDWLMPRLEAAGYRADRLRTRHQPDAAFGFTGGVYTDLAAACGSATADDVALASLWATPASDALFLGHGRPFLGLFLGLTGTLNANASVLSVAAWNGQAWTSVAGLADGTVAAAGKTLSGGGRVTWRLPDDWVERAINGARAYWVRLQVSAALTAGTTANQALPILRSRLTHPTALHALSLIYREGASSRRGAWLEQADSYAEQAQAALDAVLPLVVDEFDADADDAVGPTEADAARPADARWSLERG